MDTRDKVVVDETKEEITIIDNYGIKIVYEEALNDMMEIEEELLKIGSYYINKHEFVGDSDQFEPYNPLDRAEIVMNLME
jgi:hypothetical protein